MRDYRNIDKYLDRLLLDIYPQPQDIGHTEWASENILFSIPLLKDAHTILDVGCGEGFCQPLFEIQGLEYTGIAMGEDVKIAFQNKKNVFEMDFTFMTFPDGAFDIVYSRHSLEHSPMPLLTLKEWHRVSNKYISLVLPSTEYWKYRGRNHYYVLNPEQWENLFDIVGFNILSSHKFYKPMGEENNPLSLIEYWYVLEKKNED